MVVMNPTGDLKGPLIQVTLFQRSQPTYCTCNPCQTVTKGPYRSSVARSGTDAVAWVLVVRWGVIYVVVVVVVVTSLQAAVMVVVW